MPVVYDVTPQSRVFNLGRNIYFIMHRMMSVLDLYRDFAGDG